MKNICCFLMICVMVSHAKVEKVRAHIKDNPSYNMVIGWDQVSGKNARIYYGTKDEGKSTGDYPMNESVYKKKSTYGMNHNFVNLKNLAPNTKYYFVIQDSEGVSSRFWFKTLPDEPSHRLRIIAGGDSRSNEDVRQKITSALRDPAIRFAF